MGLNEFGHIKNLVKLFEEEKISQKGNVASDTTSIQRHEFGKAVQISGKNTYHSSAGGFFVQKIFSNLHLHFGILDAKIIHGNMLRM